MKKRGLFPAIEPYNFGYLPVGDGHEMYYEECGNPKGIPVLYIHGGPGAGCDPGSRRFFDREKCRIIIFDQRGCGRSKPYKSIRANTTQHLVYDIHTLLKELGIRLVLLFGGSWGSTLALVYAIAYPETLLGLVLRGIFLGSRGECADYLSGQMVHTRYPEIGERFLDHVPIEARSNPSDYYFEQMCSEDHEVRRKYSYEFVYYEAARLNLVQKSESALRKEILSEPYEAQAIMEVYYIRNSCFLEDGYILKHAKELSHVPTSIIHGRFDDVCPVQSAFALHAAMPWAQLHIVTAGHARSDPEIRTMLITETDRIVSELLQ